MDRDRENLGQLRIEDKAVQQTYLCLKSVKHLNHNSHKTHENSEACERIARKNFDLKLQEAERQKIESVGKDGPGSFGFKNGAKSGENEGEEEKKTPFPKDNWDRQHFYVKEFREPKWRDIAKSGNVLSTA